MCAIIHCCTHNCCWKSSLRTPQITLLTGHPQPLRPTPSSFFSPPPSHYSETPPRSPRCPNMPPATATNPSASVLTSEQIYAQLLTGNFGTDQRNQRIHSAGRERGRFPSPPPPQSSQTNVHIPSAGQTGITQTEKAPRSRKVTWESQASFQNSALLLTRKQTFGKKVKKDI